MLNKFILSIALTCFVSAFANSQRDPKNSTLLITLDSKMAFLDYMPLNDSCVVVMKTVEKENFIEVVGSVELAPQKLEIEHPIGFRQDQQENVYLITSDYAYKVTVGEELSFEAPELLSDFVAILNRYEPTKTTEFQTYYNDGWTDLLVLAPGASFPDTISIKADYRITDLNGRTYVKTANQTKVNSRNPSYDYGYDRNQLNHDKEDWANRKMEQTRQRQSSRRQAPRKHSYYQPQYFMDGDELLIIDGKAQSIARYSKDGTLISINEINYARPLIWSLGTDEFKYDNERKELIICSENSKGYQYSKLDPSTGEATLIYKTKKYWRKSHSKTVGNKLYYIQSNSFGVDQLYSVAV